MGEQTTYSISEAIEETISGSNLSYFDKNTSDAILRDFHKDPIKYSELFSLVIRFNTLYMISRAGSGHIGSSFSSIDVVTWLHLVVMQEGDRYFSSKGHDAPGLYAVQAALGVIPFNQIDVLRDYGGIPGHPDVSTAGSFTNTGSLGMGISKAKGFTFADRFTGHSSRRTFVMTGDGELQEGQIWESLISAANDSMGEITVIVDHNKVQSDCLVSAVSSLGDLEKKFSAFGWEVRRCNGHDFNALSRVFHELSSVTSKPKVVIADTIKGYGVQFMQHTSMAEGEQYYKYHSGAPSVNEYAQAVAELLENIASLSSELKLALPSPLQSTVKQLRPPKNAQRLIPAYTNALLRIAQDYPALVALDADLILDTGLIPFKNQFPKQFIECGIAEQDMVSRASTLALSGLLPVVHSFACFLTARPNEQIYNAVTEKTKIIYVGSLAGLIPGGPGHSHQAVRDIAALSGMPGLIMLEPGTCKQVQSALEWCVSKATGPTYLRLTSVPFEHRSELDSDSELIIGQGQILRQGNDVALIGYGPVMLVEMLKAADLLAAEGISARVINLPWLNTVDKTWLLSALSGLRATITVDNHYLHGGQGQFLRSTLCCELPQSHQILSLGVSDLPVCGRNDDVLKHHRLDFRSLADAVMLIV